MDLRRSKIMEGTGRLTAILNDILHHNTTSGFSEKPTAVRKRPLIPREEGKVNHYHNSMHSGNVSSSPTKRRKTMKITQDRRIDDRLSDLPDQRPNNNTGGFSEKPNAVRKMPLIPREEGKANHYKKFMLVGNSSSSSSTKRRKTIMIQDRRIDRLSALPDDILHHVLSFLDTKSSVQTCILSKRWTSLWKYVHVLTFDSFSFCSARSFEQHTDRVLSLRSDSSSISMVAADLVLADPERMDLLDRIMKYAASHGVQELFICPAGLGSFPDLFRSIYACHQSLKFLELDSTFFREAYGELWSCLQMLESLTLTACDLNLGDDAFGNLPRLESLKLIKCSPCFGGTLKVIGPKLLNLEIDSWQFTSLEIVVPKLQSFTLKIGDLCKIKDCVRLESSFP